MPALLAEQLIALTIDETSAQPVVLVIDDLHWADPASVKLWGRLARTAHQVPLLLIGVTRPVPQREDLLALRRAVDDAHRVQLGSLAQPAVAELVGTLAGGRPDTGLLRLAAGAAGNPLYLTEMLAALARSGGITVTPTGTAQLADGAVPDSLPGAIADRLGFVSASTREVLRAAALLGVEFAITDLTAVLGRTVAALVPALDEARATGVLTDSGVGLAFRHPLIREALYAEMPASVRAAWHRDAGHALASAGAAPDRVARQLLRALGGPGSAARETPGAPDRLTDEIERPHTGTSPAPAGVRGHGHRDRAAAGRPGLGLAIRAGGRVDDGLAGRLGRLAGRPGARGGGGAARPRRSPASRPGPPSTAGWPAGSPTPSTGPATGRRPCGWRSGRSATPPIPTWWWTCTGRWPSAGCWQARAPSPSRRSTGRSPRPALSAKHRARLLVLAARTYLYLGELEAADREADGALASAQEVG